MEESGLAKLERIAGNLPCLHVERGMVESRLGKIYVALGRAEGVDFPGISWHGVWSFSYGDEQGIARQGEVEGSLSLKEAQQQFVDDAAMNMALFNQRGMLDKSYRLNNG